jgi:hypothetical protein
MQTLHGTPFSWIVYVLVILCQTVQADESEFEKAARYSTLLKQEVQARIEVHQSLLNESYQALLPSIRAKSPTKAVELENAFEKKEVRGYQNLPAITVVENEPSPLRPIPRYYDWQLCTRILEADHPALTGLADELKLATSIADLEKIADRLIALKHSSIALGRHASYNEVWQGHIANPEWRTFFDRNTAIFTALEQGCDTNLPFCGITDPTLQNQIRFNQQLQSPVRSIRRRQSESTTTLEIKITTDITDDTFLESFKAAVLKYWKRDVQGNNIEVVPVFEKISPEKLYEGESPPRNGESIDLQQHLLRFTGHRAVLTTGAVSTYCTTNHICALGPQELSNKTLAHEFGHLLGFSDCYYRGYRPKGFRGFQILEIESDFRDIMCSISTGQVHQSHLLQLLAVAS